MQQSFTITCAVSLSRGQVSSIYADVLGKHWSSFTNFFLVRQQGKGFHLTPKGFLLNIFSKTQISETDQVRERSILAVRIAKYGPLREPIQNAPFHHGPLRPYNEVCYFIPDISNLGLTRKTR